MTHRWLFTFPLLLLGMVAPTLAQQQPNAGNAGSIRGTVIDTRTSQPLNGATVALQNLQASGGWNSTTTTADGGFVFHGIVAGRYRLRGSHTGYVDSLGGHGAPNRAQAGGSPISLAAGQDIDGIVLRLTPTGVISGRITNERDEPMAGVLVQAMRASYRSGHREFSDARTGFTDDRGEFRVWGLAPGQYFLKATNPRVSERGPAPAQVYVPMFYPGVLDPAQTQAVELRPGDELNGINLSLAPLRTVHVRGRVLTANGGPAKGADITLLQSGSGYSVETETNAEGRFDMASVPPGSYEAAAQLSDNSESGHVQMGRATVSVGETALDIPDLVVFPGATISGRVRVEGDRKLSMPRAFASLKPLTNSPALGNVETAPVQPDGTFTFHDVPEGEYGLGLTALPDGYYVKGARDTAATGILVSHGHAPTAEIRIGPGAGRVQGVAYRDKDNQVVAASVTIVLIPDVTRRSNSEYYRVAMTDRSGNYVLASIPPGDYSLFAFENIDRDAYMDPDFVQKYEAAGKPLRVEEGSNLSLQLQLVTETQDSQ
jgi:protocatechuate 3,4-dioxygenase beta subunit